MGPGALALPYRRQTCDLTSLLPQVQPSGRVCCHRWRHHSHIPQQVSDLPHYPNTLPLPRTTVPHKPPLPSTVPVFGYQGS